MEPSIPDGRPAPLFCSAARAVVRIVAAPLLELRDVHKSYPGPEPVPVLKGASLALARGESVAIVGPSGSGKSTILNLLGTLDLPDRGTITLDGRDLTKLTAKELARLRPDLTQGRSTAHDADEEVGGAVSVNELAAQLLPRKKS